MFNVLNTNLNIFELITYFSPEIISLLGVFLNLSVSSFVIYNPKLKELSNYSVCGVFCINLIFLIVFLLRNEFFFIAKDVIVFNSNTILLKFFVYLFALFFVIATYKFTKKAQFRVPVVNSILILIIMFSGLLLTSDNFTFIYILLEVIVFLIYQYASNLRFKKTGIYSPVYIAISFCATILFLIFYSVDTFVYEIMQKSIIQSCMVLALLLKIGLFPVFNYSMDKKSRSNIPYSILLFCFLPFVGAVSFNKIISLCMFNEICHLCTTVFLLLFTLTTLISIVKSKTLTGYLIYLVQVYTCFYITDTMYTKELNTKFMIIVMLVLLILYSMLRIYKNTGKNTLIFSCVLFLSAFLIPLFGLNSLFNIYTFDKFGFYTLNVFVLSDILIIIKTLSLIEGFYKVKSLK